MPQSNQPPKSDIEAISKQLSIYDKIQKHANLQIEMQKAFNLKIPVPQIPSLAMGSVVQHQIELQERLGESLNFGKALQKVLDFKLPVADFPSLSIGHLLSEQNIVASFAKHIDEVIKGASSKWLQDLPSQSIVTSTALAKISQHVNSIERQIAERFDLSKFFAQHSAISSAITDVPNFDGLLNDRFIADFERLSDIANQLHLQEDNFPPESLSNEQCELLQSFACELPKSDSLVDAVFQLSLAIGELSLAGKASDNKYRALFNYLWLSLLLPILGLICAAVATPQYAERQRYLNGLESFHISRTLSAQQKLLYPPNCIVQRDCMASTVVGQTVQSSSLQAGTSARMLNKLRTACEIEWLQDGTPKRGWIEVKNLAFPKL